MSTRPTEPTPSLAVPLVGAVVWVLSVVSASVGPRQLSLLDAMLLLAVLVVVPAAIPLHPAAGARLSTVALLAALPVAPGLLVDHDVAAALLVAPWLLGAGSGAILSGRWWWRTDRHLEDVVWPAAATYLLVGAAWLLADRLDLQPAGVAAPFVQLTAIHFHYAGFASVTLVGTAWTWSPHSRLAAASAVLTVAASPVIAIGFVSVGLLQVVGATLLTIGLWLLAWITVRHAVRRVRRLPGVLLALSSAAVVVPMALAVQWAVGTNLGTPALSIPDMARYHGVTNAVGFTLLGVIGWRLVEGRTHDS